MEKEVEEEKHSQAYQLRKLERSMKRWDKHEPQEPKTDRFWEGVSAGVSTITFIISVVVLITVITLKVM